MKAYRPYIFLIIAIAVFMTLFFWHYNEQHIRIGNPISMQDDWTYQGTDITLPTSLDIPANEAYTITTTLNGDFRHRSFIFVRTSLQNITVRLDGRVIYEKTYGETLDRPYASMWHTIPTPHDAQGATLSITFSSPYSRMSGEVNNITYGTIGMQFAYILRTYGIRLIMAAIVFLVGFIVMTTDLFFSKKQTRGFTHMGLFAILLSFWMFAESKTLQLFTGSPLFIGSLAYLTLPLFGIPLITYVCKYVLKHYKTPLYVIQGLLTLQFISLIVLYLFQVADFFQTLIVSQILLILGIITMVTSLLCESIKYHNHKATQFIKAFGILIVFGIVELINFLVGNYTDTSVYVSIGVAILMVILLIVYIKYIINSIKESQEKALYEKLAYLDQLTQGNNRAAFERDLKKIFNDEQLEKRRRLILFDLDDLKDINDKHGHIEGDKALKKAYHIITNAFKDYGSCYRIGGDEFVCIYDNDDEEVYREKKAFIIEKFTQYEQQVKFKFGLSTGSTIITSKDKDVDALVHLADLDMYHNKKRKKHS